MIKIGGTLIEPNSILNKYAPNSIERKIANIMVSSNEVYYFDTQRQLDFELTLRKSIVNAARDLSRSRMEFRTFRKSKCNEDYWNRTPEGGFSLKNGVRPSDAIKDIFIHSYRYGTECATAMVIVYYKALVDIFPAEQFNRMFPHIYLMNWQRIDYNLGLVDHMRVADYLPGDCRYFRNPEVDPLKPEWQGENAIQMDNDLYYGHGIGITTGDRIIEILNKKRRRGATISAYLLKSAKRLNSKFLSSKYYSSSPRVEGDYYSYNQEFL